MRMMEGMALGSEECESMGRVWRVWGDSDQDGGRAVVVRCLPWRRCHLESRRLESG
jgi:hypothetical protein